MPETLAASRIAAAGGGFEPQRQNNFLLRLTPPSAVGAEQSVIEFALQAFPFPKSETTVEAIHYLNSERKVPGRTTYAQLPLVVKDYVDQQVAETCDKWRALVFDPVSGATGLATNIKVEGELVMFAPDGTTERTWTLVGLWPSSVDHGDGNMDNTAPVDITMNLQVDYWYRKV